MVKIRLVSDTNGRRTANLIWKAFKARHATALALHGSSLLQILEAGEWKRKAFLRYVDEQTIDETQFRNATFDGSDKEGER